MVTGAQGLLGRHLVAEVLAGDAEAVLGVGRSPRRDDAYTHDLGWLGRRVPAPLPDYLLGDVADPRYRYVQLDVADTDAVAAAGREFRPGLVIHAAAALRDESWSRLFDANIQAVFGLVNGLAAGGSPRVVLVSSGSVYGASGDLPFRELGPAVPVDFYGASKRAGEDIARILTTGHGVPLTVARVFNLVGPGLQDRHLPAVLAARLAAIARGLAEPVLRLGPLATTRDFIDVRDAARALVLLARAPTVEAVVNVASGTETHVRVVLDDLLDLTGLAARVRPEYGERRPADVPRAYANVGRLHDLGFSLRHDLRGTLTEMLGYFEGFPSV